MPKSIKRLSDDQVRAMLGAAIIGIALWILVLELVPVWVDSAKKPRFFQMHLALTGLFMFWQYRQIGMPRSSKSLHSLSITFLSWGLAAINAFVPGAAILNWDQAYFWCLPLTIIAGINAFTVYRLEVDQDAEDADLSDVPTAEPNDDVYEEHPKQRSLIQGVFSGYVWQAIAIGLTIGFVTIIIGFGSFYYTLLYKSLSSETYIDPGRVASSILQLAESLGLLIIAPSLAVVTLFLIGGAGHVVYVLLQKRNRSDYDRELSDEELEFVFEGSEAVFEFATDFKDRNKLGKLHGFLYYGLVFGPMIAAFIGALIFTPIIAGSFEPERANGAVVFVYQTIDFGASGLILLFALIMLAWSIVQSFSYFAPRLAIYFYLMGWANRNDRARTETDYYLTLTDFVRSGVFVPGKTFNPETFIHKSYRKFEPLVYTATAILLALTLGFGFLDLRYYEMFTEDRIEYSDYWTQKKHVLSYSEVQNVELACYTYTDDGQLKLDIDFNVQVTPDRSIDLFKNENLKMPLLEQLSLIDAKLKANNVPFNRRERSGYRGNNSGYIANCRERLVDQYGEERGALLADLLQTDP